MAIEININEDDINELVKNSIMKAGFGKAITDAISKVFTGYNNPVDEQLKKYVAEVTAQLIREKYEVEIKAAVVAAIEERVTPEMTAKVVDTAMNKIERAVDY